ncbi:MAG: discoidin domain-containing protein, partial [Planctomycetota bacterium]
MSGKITYFICFALIVSAISSVQAVPFSLLPAHDAEIGNDVQIGPDQNSGGGSGMAFRDIDVRRRVSFVSYDISELKSGGQIVSNVSFSNYGHDSGTVHVYGVIEELDNIDEATITWNTAPGVQNDPAPPIGDPVALDLDDLTEELMDFVSPARGERSSTDTSQALADFINSDTDGIITFLFAPSAGGNNGIVRTKELGEGGGTLLEGELTGLPESARYPIPADNDIDVARDVVLNWTPGGYAEKHDVYLGKNFDDVNAASTTIDPTGVYHGRQDPNQFPAIGTVRLQIGETYYWRIDGVGAAPGNEIYRGKVWQFTVEPYSFAIDGGTIAARASSNVEGKGPENTVNGSGLDETGLLHGNIGDGAMWLSSPGADQPTWIEYDLGRTYKLHEMWVWNANESLETMVGIGFKEVLIEYSDDGIEFITFGTTHEFTQGPGEPDYEHNTTIDMEGIAARYVRLTANSNWFNILEQYSLSEVRFFYVPVQARAPKPAPGETEVPLDVTLGWTAGREAAEHKIYLSTSEQAVI